MGLKCGVHGPDLPRTLSPYWWRCVMVCGKCLLGTLSSLNQSIIAWRPEAIWALLLTMDHSFKASIWPSVNSYLQHDNAPCHKAISISDWFHEIISIFFSGLRSQESHPRPLGCCKMEDSHHKNSPKRCEGIAWCKDAKMNQIFKVNVSDSLWNPSHKVLRTK